MNCEESSATVHRARKNRSGGSGRGDAVEDSMEIQENPWEPKEGEMLAPTVDPADVKAAWQLYHDADFRMPGQQVAIARSMFEHVCSPGADIPAICHRAVMLKFIFLNVDHSPEEPEAKELARFRHDGELHDRLFRIMSQIALRWIPKEGLPGFPFDGEEFLKQLREAA
jgi:hypothetical protein